MQDVVRAEDNCHRIRVLTADDMPAFKAGLATAIKRHPRLAHAGDASDGLEALRLARELQPSVVVLDLALRRLSGQSVLRAIKREQPETRVLVLTSIVDGKTVYEALRASADGYLSKAAELDEICEAVIALSQGDKIVARGLTRSLASEIQSRSVEDEELELSPREIEVVGLMAEGNSTHEIAATLYIAHATVKSHRRAIFRKLGVHDHGAAVAQAFRKRILAL